MEFIQKRILLDKTILLILPFIIFFRTSYTHQMVIYILIAISFSALNWLFSYRYIREVLFLAYCLLCLTSEHFRLFLPFLYYDSWQEPRCPLSSLLLELISLGISLFAGADPLPLYETPIIGFICLLVIYLANSSRSLSKIHYQLIQLEDSNHEKHVRLTSQQNQLLEQQSQNLTLAVSKERNRIARDIHDTVGHLLSSALLQTGALQAVNQNEDVTFLLKQLRHTLEESMDNIRNSVHDLYDESLDIEQALQNLLKKFTMCPVQLEFDISEKVGDELKVVILVLIQEALSNIMKHSCATNVAIEILEHPGFYRLAIKNNGCSTQTTQTLNRGIGLASMGERVEQLDGRLTFTHDKATFTVLAIFPKKQKKEQ